MATSSPRPRVLVPIDFSAQQEAVLARAVLLANKIDAEIVLLHCATPLELSMIAVEPVYVPAAVIERFAGDHLQEASARLDKVKAELSAPGGVQTMVRATTPTAGIISAANELACDFVVMGSHGAGLDRFLLGSVAEAVVRAAPCPVIVQRDTEDVKAIESVMVGIDFSVYSAPLVALAREIATDSGQIHLFHCWQPPHLDSAHVFGDPGHASLVSTLSDGMQLHCRELERFVADQPDDARYRLHVEQGRPARTLLDSYDELGVQAILVGAHDADSAQHVLGSVSDRVLRHAKTTVVLTDAARQALSA